MQLLVAITVLYSLIPPVVYWFVKKKMNNEIKPVFPFIVLSFIAGFYEFVFTVLLYVNTIPWFYIYVLNSILFLLYTRKKNKKNSVD